ncbi:transglycosylase SLT domain-containing protein [Deferribacterales bacterium Es71-Z0220]|uniref:transglycosylase SLT domain-containing protein n=1 Tax=Deferrivibrio essentukiensis TaxID=2880922 RepID=UPI001F6027B5|nr:transglycosylase SLT domain-containing protein [Deferrivibrio essentukiensis]
MKKLLFLILACLFVFTSVQADEFEQFKDNFLGEFDSYKKQLDEEFENYKRILDEELQNYKKEIGAYWSDLKISNNKIFVEYSQDKKSRKIVDYENDRLIVEVKVDNLSDKTSSIRKVQELVEDTINENLVTAFERDQVSKNVERRLSKKSNIVVTGDIPKVNVLSPYIAKETDLEKIRENIKISDIKEVDGKDSKVLRVEINLPNKDLKEKVNFVKKYVFNYAGVHRIRPEVIFSIIHNESYFNPLAKSYVPAYGLMQIVPKTAGADATKFLFGKEKILAPSYLYNPDNNIKIGAAYFRILYYSYLKDIKNPTSRLYCSIAAYNTGSGNVAKAFVGSYNISAAVNVINRMSPDDVYRTLKRSLPYDETKRYLDKVLDKIKVYEAAL